MRKKTDLRAAQQRINRQETKEKSMPSFSARNPIAFTKVKLPFGWLGNMSAHPVSLKVQHERTYWQTTEHLFQAMRLPPDHPAVAEMCKNGNPMAAKLVAKAHADDFIVAPCSEQDLENMRLCLRTKLAQHHTLHLAETGTRVIIEDVSSRRNKGSALFWGAASDGGGQWTGENWLGELWMEIRDAE